MLAAAASDATMFRAVLFGVVGLLLACAASAVDGGDRRSYIVQMDASAMPSPFVEHEGWYMSVLSSLAAATGEGAPEHLYTYTHAMHGFSTVLTARQLEELRRTEGHVAAFPETYARLHTTRTPEFLGLSGGAGVWPASKYGDDVIIGIVDTGVWPESESFSDAGIQRPVPSRWKGACEAGAAFKASMCNRKLIGARSFSKGLKKSGLTISRGDYDSPRDYYGHGSHTSSTAAGSAVKGASYFGYANGTATGIAPMARVAMYKAVFSADTLESASTDVLAAMDRAIADGVDVMSLSLGFPETSYDTNVIAIGAFSAMQKGIFVTCSAGNDGSDGYTIMNGAPWITTVGASSIDRDFTATVTLGSGSGARRIQGKSVYPQSTAVAGANLYYGHGNKSKQKCEYSSLSRKDVSGRYVFCTAGESVRQQMDEVQSNGGRGAIIASDMKEFLQPTEYTMPLVLVTLSDGAAIAKYVTAAATRGAPKVSTRFVLTELGVKPAPTVAYFSARGPSQISPAILKPDVVAPGVDILAAWVPNKEIMELGKQKLFAKYMLVSGTSMSSPHVAGVAALLRSVHPDWSPAAIRSAMMTTAYVKDNANNVIVSMPSGSPATPLDFGSGHVSPDQAMDPGLVYDVAADDYIRFLCGLRYSSRQIAALTGRRNPSCAGANLDLNYPSFMVILNTTNSATRTFKRVLTNVAGSPTKYSVSVTAPAGMKVTVAPPALSFGSKGSKQAFTVTVQVSQVKRGSDDDSYIGNYGFLSWNEVGGKHVVRSPIVSAFAQ
ncbi:subtilisin-like protease SBT1.7 [Phragmites australis]|uniref:subtilisin-like protease SBT1.7 n=1 Tax=Phragmites australis TaxID=29695 RepID=UPI002D78EB3B|nr:subtilisin-like protease SBT1.7 [Phragmites australis]